MKVSTIRRASVAGLAAVALLGTTACSAINLQATTMEYSPSDGIIANVGDVQVRNLAVVTAGSNTEGRLIGTLSVGSVNPNDTQFPSHQVTITINNEASSFTVTGEENITLEDPAHETIISNTGSAPGHMVDAEISVDGETESVVVSVLDGTLPEYEPFIPGEWDRDQHTSHLYDYNEDGGH